MYPHLSGGGCIGLVGQIMSSSIFGNENGQYNIYFVDVCTIYTDKMWMCVCSVIRLMC